MDLSKGGGVHTCMYVHTCTCIFRREMLLGMLTNYSHYFFSCDHMNFWEFTGDLIYYYFSGPIYFYDLKVTY
jgi:hypothetical protein